MTKRHKWRCLHCDRFFCPVPETIGFGSTAPITKTQHDAFLAEKKRNGICIQPGLCICKNMRRCPSCNYTSHDKRILMDHSYCKRA